MPAIGSLTVDLIAQTASFNANIEKAARNLDQNAGRINRSLDSVKKNIAGMRAEAEGLALGLFIREAAQFVKKNLDMAGSLGETAQQLGVTTRELQVFRAMGGQAGIAAEQMDTGLQKLTVSIGKASLGAKSQNEAFAALGISVRDASGQVKSTGVVLGEIADKLSKIKDPAQRAAVEVEIFGRSGQKLDTILSGGKASITAYGKEAERLGMILSDDVINQADQAADKIDELNTQLKANIARTVAENSGAILGLANALITLTSAAVGFINKHPQLTSALVGAAAGARVAGAPGAIVGAGVGVVGGALLSRGTSDSNMDLNFRRAELEKAQEVQRQFLEAKPTTLFKLRRGSQDGGTLESATAELRRQTELTRQAIAYAAQNNAPAAVAGSALPNFLGDDPKKTSTGTKPRTNREILADFQRELAKRGVGVVPNAIRTAKEQNDLFKLRLTPLDGYTNPSRHQNAQAIDFNRSTFDENKVREAAQAAGLKGFELITESGGRKHAEWTGAGKPGDLADMIKSAEQAQAEAQRNQEQFQNTLDGLNADLLSAKEANVTDANELVRIAKEQVTAEATHLKTAIDAEAASNPIIAAKAEELKAIVDRVAAEKSLTIDTQEAQRKSEEALQVQVAANDNEITLLQLQEGLAVTSQQRRDIALRILEIEKASERAALEKQAADKSLSDATRQLAQNRLNQLDTEYSLKSQAVVSLTKGPLDRYLDETDPAKLGERAEGLVVEQLQYVSRGISDAIAGALGVQDPLLRGLIDMFIEQVLIRPIAQALQGAMGGSGGGGLFGAILGIGGSLIGGGGIGAMGSGAMGSSSLGGGLAAIGAGFAKGTNNAPPGYAWVGEQGPELLKFRGGEQVIPNGALRAANNNGGGTYNVHVNGAGMTERQARETGAQIQRGIRQEQARNMRMGA